MLNTFEYAVKQVAVTLIREAKFELKDFATSKKRGISGFDLRLEKREVHDQTQWWGTFAYGHKKLKVIGTLEA